METMVKKVKLKDLPIKDKEGNIQSYTERELTINVVNGDLGWELLGCVSNILKENNIELGSANISNLNEIASLFINTILGSISNKELNNIILECCKYCYFENGQKIDKDFFNDPLNWHFRIPIYKEVLLTNLRPFFNGGLFTELSTILKTLNTDTPV